PHPRMAGLEPLHRRCPDETLPPPDDLLDEPGAMRDEPPRQENEPRNERDKQERGSKRVVGCHGRALLDLKDESYGRTTGVVSANRSPGHGRDRSRTVQVRCLHFVYRARRFGFPAYAGGVARRCLYMRCPRFHHVLHSAYRTCLGAGT